ncbi:MAG: cytoplasmic protein [Desulfobacteraceae bacterium]|nr:cytoplasmic protein [Desulfobacteraceae bacterium]MBC2718936.1 cytoplasmic protein [Desulfobacteraceae bacterium]
MLKNELIFRNPLRLMEHETEDILQSGGFGAVLARAGLGKTAILVQLALDSLLRSRNVLHISLDDSVKKVCLWYEEVFRNIADQYNIGQIEHLWESIVSHRLIMTFKVDSFSVPKLEERLTDLIEQNIFLPQAILIDGLPFDKDIIKPLTELKKLAESRLMHVWFTVRTHRYDKPGPDGMPDSLLHLADLFDVIIQLQPEGKEIHVKALKGGPAACDYPELLLDPSTMLIKKG